MRKTKKKAAVLAGEAASKNTSCKTNHSGNVPAVQSASQTKIQAQRDKVLVLLRQGPKTTIDLRTHGIMMPATRVFELRNNCGHNITSELVPLFDAYGFRHLKCARYHLVIESASGDAE